MLASEHVLGVSVIARKQLNEDISRMLALAASNVETSFLAFEHRDEYELEQIQNVRKRLIFTMPSYPEGFQGPCSGKFPV